MRKESVAELLIIGALFIGAIILYEKGSSAASSNSISTTPANFGTTLESPAVSAPELTGNGTALTVDPSTGLDLLTNDMPVMPLPAVPGL